MSKYKSASRRGPIAEQNALNFLEVNKEAFDLITGLDIIEHYHEAECCWSWMLYLARSATPADAQC